MTLSQYEYAGRKWVLTDRPFQDDGHGGLKTGLRIPGIPNDAIKPGIVFSLSRADLDRVDLQQWIDKGRVIPFVEPPPKPKTKRRRPTAKEIVDGTAANG